MMADNKRGAEEATVAHCMVGIFLGTATVVFCIIYLVEARLYRGHGFVDVIAWPTLAVSLGFLCQQLIRIRSIQRSDGAAVSRGSKTIVEKRSNVVNVKGLITGLLLLAAFIGMLISIGYFLATVLIVGIGPIISGQPSRRVPLFLLVGALLAVILSIVLKLSGIVQLDGGLFHLVLPL